MTLDGVNKALLDPWALKNFLGGGSGLGILLKAGFDNGPRAVGNVAGDVKLVFDYFTVQFFVVFASEGEATTEEGEEKDTGCVDIRIWAAKFNFLNDLRRHV